MITANFIHRTLRIRCGESVGTAFTIDVDSRQYLVTARHVVQAFNSGVGLELFGNGTWTTADTQLVSHGPDQVDVSVFAPSKPLSPPGLAVQASSAGLAYGQEVFFLGFPYDLLGNVVFDPEGYHLPFVKRATISCFAGNVYFLDGHNNPGFSAGPVLFGPVGAPPTNVAAVISGYKSVQEPVYHQDDATPLSFKYNTGIMVAYKIETALALIEESPIGAPV
jgi:hypothetical protein